LVYFLILLILWQFLGIIMKFSFESSLREWIIAAEFNFSLYFQSFAVHKREIQYATMGEWGSCCF